MFVADREFAARLQRMVTAEYEEFVGLAKALYPETRATIEPFADGFALYGADEIPFHDVGGFGTGTAPTAAEIDALADFYDERDASSNVLLPSLGDTAMIPEFTRRGWHPSGFEDVFVLPMEDRAVESCVESSWAGMDIRVVRNDQREEWGRCVADGFATDTPSERELRFARIIASRPDATFVWAWVGGKPVATGEFAVVNGVGWLSADTTLPKYRGRGIQQALQRYRIALAREHGCELVVTEAVPGGASHRNIQRVGFRQAFTHLILTRPSNGG